jgi:hypothetical protein
MSYVNFKNKIMKVPETYYTEIFAFNGRWDLPSKCGLKIIEKENIKHVIVTELYQDNPGTSITAAGYLLAKQICDNKGLSLPDIVYIECTPDTNSVLSFYDEQYYKVIFNEKQQAQYSKLSQEYIEHLFLSR